MVIEHVQDLDLRSTPEAPVRDVGLPAFVRHLGREPDERAARALLRLGRDEAAPGEHPPDRRDRRCRSLATAQVVGDRVGTGIQALIGELLAERDDLVLEGLGRPVRDRLRSAGAGLEPCLPLGIEASADLVDPPR